MLPKAAALAKVFTLRIFLGFTGEKEDLTCFSVHSLIVQPSAYEHSHLITICAKKHIGKLVLISNSHKNKIKIQIRYQILHRSHCQRQMWKIYTTTRIITWNLSCNAKMSSIFISCHFIIQLYSFNINWRGESGPLLNLVARRLRVLSSQTEQFFFAKPLHTYIEIKYSDKI